MVTAPAYSVPPSVKTPRTRNHCRAQHDAFIDELTAVAIAHGLETRAVGSAMFWSKTWDEIPATVPANHGDGILR